MIKVLLYKSKNVRAGQVPLRFRLQDGDSVDLALETDKLVEATDLFAFAPDGSLRTGKDYNPVVKREIDYYKTVMAEVYLAMLQAGAAIDDDSFQRAVEERLAQEVNPSPAPQSLAERYRQYIEEEFASGRQGEKMYRNSVALANKLERYLAVRDRQGIVASAFTPEMVVDFEKFCIDEYLYASDPKYAAIYPKSYEAGRSWPKHKLKEEPLRKMLISFDAFWRDLVSFGEIEKSPYDDYVPWMQEKKYARYVEMIGDPVSLTIDEFKKVVSTPVPEKLLGIRNAFILQVCLGIRGIDFEKLSFDNVRVSKEGIPYIYYKETTSRTKDKSGEKFEHFIEVPLVRVAFDIVMRSRFDFFFGCYKAPYNRLIGVFLRHCGITREVCLYNVRNGQSEWVPLCAAVRQSNVPRMHMDIVHEWECLRGVRGQWYVGVRSMERMAKKPMDEHFRNLNQAFGQPPFKVDENLNVVEGAPFVPWEELAYKEQPIKLPGGSTNAYLIAELQPMPKGEGKREDRIGIRVGRSLKRERPVLVVGSQFEEFVGGLEEAHREEIFLGILLLRRMAEFNLPFVKALKGSIYVLRTALRGYIYTTSFYVNGESILLLHCRLSEKHRRNKASGEVIDLAELEKIRWGHVTGSLEARDFGKVLDERFGEVGTPYRQKCWAKACSHYVSQEIRLARQAAGLYQDHIFSQWGHKKDCGNFSDAENGTRILTLDYLTRTLEAMDLKAVLTRPYVDDGMNYFEIVTQLKKSTDDPSGKKCGAPIRGSLAAKLVR